MKDYINIKPDFSLSKDTDSAAPTGKNSHFPTMKNYIPEQGAILTREGISEFSFGGGAPYNPSDDPDCLMHLKFEGGDPGFKDCEIQGANYMVTTAGSSGHIYPSGTCRVGASSLCYHTSGMPGLGLALMYHKVNADLPALFPGEGADDIILSFWFRGVSFADWTWSIIRHDNVSLAGGFSFGFNGTNKFFLRLVNEAGGNSTCTAIYGFAYSRWYHVGIWSSKTVGNSGFLYYDATTGGEEAVVMSPVGTLGGADRRSGNFWVGLGTRKVLELYLDDFILCNATPSTEAAILTKIRNMRARGL